MKKLLLILTVFPCIIFAQDQKAKSILDKLSDKTKSYTSIEAKFTNTFTSTVTDISESQSGTLYLKDDSYRLEMESQTIICDGETNWIYLADDDEVNITEVDDEENELNPSKIFTIYENGYKYKFVKEDGKNYHIDLFPKESGPFTKVELFINKSKMQISSFTMIDKQGSHFKYVIDSFVTNKEMNNDFFVFKIADYPNVDVIDLR
ncbi:MAG: outer membrane lipoprotein carrier protein LolA [Flavobacteriales bacterium]|nr:outer membrane lipoprotein carrier protein LolA [Flavobacteriales bacterium]